MPYSSNERRREAYQKYKDKIKAGVKKWQDSHKEQIKERKRAYRQSLSRDQKDKENAASRERYYRNIEKDKARKIRWRANNLDKVAASSSNIRAAKLNRTPSWLTKEDLGKIKEIYKEAQKKKEETGEEWHVDHIIPLQGKNISGLHVPDNLQVIKATENLSKHNRYEI